MNNILNRILIEWNDSDLEDGIIKSSDVKNKLKIPDIEDLEIMIEGLMEIDPKDNKYYKPITLSLLKKLFEAFNISWEIKIFPNVSKFRQSYRISREIIPKTESGQNGKQLFPIDTEHNKSMHIYTPWGFGAVKEEDLLIIGLATDPDSYISKYNLFYTSWVGGDKLWHHCSDKTNITELAKYIHELLEEIANNYE